MNSTLVQESDASIQTQVADVSKDTSGIGGHPKGLTTLFFTEMWERFSYYGMRALLVLYMVAPQSAGGLELDTAKATSIYGIYTSAVYFTNIFGGFLADRLLGARHSERRVVVGERGEHWWRGAASRDHDQPAT